MTALREFGAAPWRVRVWVAMAALLALMLPVLLSTWPVPVLQARDLVAAAALVAGSVVNVELGRLFEGGKVAQQRPHKALSAWPMKRINVVNLPADILSIAKW